MNNLDCRAVASRTYKWGRVVLDANGVAVPGGTWWFRTRAVASGRGTDRNLMPRYYAIARAEVLP